MSRPCQAYCELEVGQRFKIPGLQTKTIDFGLVDNDGGSDDGSIYRMRALRVNSVGGVIQGYTGAYALFLSAVSFFGLHDLLKDLRISGRNNARFDKEYGLTAKRLQVQNTQNYSFLLRMLDEKRGRSFTYSLHFHLISLPRAKVHQPGRRGPEADLQLNFK